MSHHSTDVFGVSLINPDVLQMRSVIASLNDAEEADFPDVSLTHESGWCLTYSDSGLLAWENIERPAAGPKFLRGVSRERVLELWQELAGGKIKQIQALSWAYDEEE